MAPPLRRKRAVGISYAFVPVPAVLIDTVMPRLSDTEWRLLCVVVRATIGWRDNASGRRKARDWLTQGQLRRRTGRGSEALSHAVDGLVRRGLVVVTNASGKPLSTRTLRRRCGGRLYFELSTAGLSAAKPVTFSDSELRKSKTTKETENKR
jgi:hypothetical protein